MHKTLLYGPTNFQDFKTKVKLYDQVTAKGTGFRSSSNIDHGYQRPFSPRTNDVRYQKNYHHTDTLNIIKVDLRFSKIRNFLQNPKSVITVGDQTISPETVQQNIED